MICLDLRFDLSAKYSFAPSIESADRPWEARSDSKRLSKKLGFLSFQNLCAFLRYLSFKKSNKNDMFRF